MLPNWYKTRTHEGVVLAPSPSGFDKGAASMGSIFVIEDDPSTLFLFYTSARDLQWSNSAIGLATSANGFDFRKIRDTILEGRHDCFCRAQALNPAVIRMDNKFYMIITGTDSLGSPRRIGIAYADDPKGPWHIIGELIKPRYLWEGKGIENGSSVVKLDNETIIIYYSSVTSSKIYDMRTFLRRYPVRRIGLLKIRIRSPSLSGIEALRFSGNPLKHLNGPRGSWNESAFCPGYIKLDNIHYLFPASSTYSIKYPYKQYIGIVIGNSPYFHKHESYITKLIDGPAEKAQIIPKVKSEIGLDMPTPFFDAEKRKIFLYYSVVDVADKVWKTALTTFNLNHEST